ncbi:hypothetical protein EHS25_001890 [Saitozyma podzolica]|uniref:Uncharacterized protein n=1 Tax=Saitozyma podzolica TaxID=1890683 RepID=A0A427YG56_9TREE|nr:hypothetical protein EHS25_001890 [Saitozyma podzolica]
MDVFLAIAGIALGITTAVVAESSAAAARGLGAANAVVAALIALLNRTGVTSTLLWIDFRANEIRADLGELRARCSYHDPAPDQAIRDIRIALDELVDRRRALQTEVTTMVFMLFFGLGNIPAWLRPSSSGLGGRSPVGVTWSRVCLVELERICVRYMATASLLLEAAGSGPKRAQGEPSDKGQGVTSRVW